MAADRGARQRPIGNPALQSRGFFVSQDSPTQPLPRPTSPAEGNVHNQKGTENCATSAARLGLKKGPLMAKTHFLANWMARGKATIPPTFHQRPHGPDSLSVFDWLCMWRAKTHGSHQLEALSGFLIKVCKFLNERRFPSGQFGPKGQVQV